MTAALPDRHAEPLWVDLLCLANSRKNGGTCVAGKTWSHGRAGPWIRPVSARPGRGVSWRERCFANGTEPAPLDIISVALLPDRPSDRQPENWLLDSGEPWVWRRSLPLRYIARFDDRPSSLWGIGTSSAKGWNDRVDTSETVVLASIALVRAEGVELLVSDEGLADRGRRCVRALFRYSGEMYNLKVTDPVYENRYQGRSGRFELGECFLTVSLTEPYDDGHCYKLVAAIFQADGWRGAR